MLRFFLLVLIANTSLCYYVIDDTPGLGRRFDGIGGLSAGVRMLI